MPIAACAASEIEFREKGWTGTDAAAPLTISTDGGTPLARRPPRTTFRRSSA